MSARGLRLALIALVWLAGCAEESAPPQPVAEPDLPFRTEKIASAHLPNALKIHPRVISGGQPAGEAAFRELRSLGVKTVISVDGARPDVDAAAKFGLRYVHLPHGYDGIPESRVRELAKAVRHLPGPIYIHCHHGKHRSPAAATVACVTTGMLDSNDALSILKMAGTSENYRGLYESATSARRADNAFLDALEVEFRATVELPPLAEAMVAIEHTHEHLKAIAAAGWRAPAAHPDIDPPHEALLLREHFTEMLRMDEVGRQPERFQQLAKDSEVAARKLEEGLRAWQPASQLAPPTAVRAALERVTKHCATCHREFRDVPLSEKLCEKVPLNR